MKPPTFNSVLVNMFYQYTINARHYLLTCGAMSLIFMLTSCDSPDSQEPALQPKVPHITHETRHHEQLKNNDLKEMTQEAPERD